MSTYKHLMVALDLSKESEAVLSKARALAASQGADISLCHIVEPLAFAYGGDVPLDMSEAQTIIESQAKKRMAALVDDMQLDTHKQIIAVGQTSSEIHEVAKEQHADLIVVGSHGRHGLALLFGSTANGVLHGAEIDVLAVRV
ncbi:universal stress protein [Agaribacterium sp. ZY112]|uniref:universal stress protein n=1 Tax=Agaribacterium sp. ZY112 TaxID=3233574 RepID=UPI003526535A